MDIEQLRTFLEVYQTRHFGMASRHLHVSQSAISARIRMLEESLKTRLFTRDRNDIQLTLAGKRLLNYAETIVRLWSEAKTSLLLAECDRTPLIIGGVATLWDILLQDWFQHLYQTFPQVALHGMTENREAQIRALLAGTMDIGFLFEPPCMTEFRVREVAVVELTMVSTRPNITAKQAVQEDYVLVNWGETFAVTHDQMFTSLPPPSVHMALGAMALRFILRRGGSGYLAVPMVQPYLEAGTLHRVADAPAFHRSAHAIYLAKNSQRALVEEVLDHLRDLSPPVTTCRQGVVKK